MRPTPWCARWRRATSRIIGRSLGRRPTSAGSTSRYRIGTETTRSDRSRPMRSTSSGATTTWSRRRRCASSSAREAWRSCRSKRWDGSGPSSPARVMSSWLATNATGTQPLVLAKDGPGRLYYRSGMQYAPRDLSVPPIDRGFAVARTYEWADRPEDVRRDPDGTWRVRLGARVRVRVTMVAPGRRYHVALVDPLPAGFEPLNPALAVTGELPKDPEAAPSPRGPGWWYWLWSRPWYEHQNLRDDRAEAFASILHGGVWEYTYMAIATTPGSFVAPPPKA